ncbi:hypothetical protein EWM64_g6548 [Hericium alpestre]|uniref:Integrase catalytic domain-containing protein n=1 Tax=Hericium alpestre TaxID=135208 RepID=A0A4Y9ZSB6_9AGAM|nr:hypothetical protein EWM64_g6548 [Hericium alpestre]
MPELDFLEKAVPPVLSAATLTLSADASYVAHIHAGYQDDQFCIRLCNNLTSTPGASECGGLLYIGDRLVVPRVGDIRATLFRLAHDALGHFGTEKSYAALRDSYYWPSMRKDLETAYVPACSDCQRNKSLSQKPSGPLHPLPVPHGPGDSVTIDFIGPLPADSGFDCIVTMMDCARSDIQIIPTHTDITAEDFAALFFDHWYCNHSLPLNIISDRDKLFVSCFWHALHRLSGIMLKMSSLFHPETDGASERTNKTVNQCLRYHIDHNQSGWVRALPLMCFNILNLLNSSTGFLHFQLLYGHSPHVIPPLVPVAIQAAEAEFPVGGERAAALIQRIQDISHEAHDNLVAAKLTQVEFANRSHSPDPAFTIGDKVLLSTLHRWHDFASADSHCAAKFLPRYDGPYTIVKASPQHSSYTLDLPNTPNIFPTFHASLLCKFIPNDDDAYPDCKLDRPGPVVTNGSEEEWIVEAIIGARRRGCGWQYRVKWRGWGSEDLRWLPYLELKDCAALDVWLAAHPTHSPQHKRRPPVP